MYCAIYVKSVAMRYKQV